jgi:hypothetical protein
MDKYIHIVPKGHRFNGEDAQLTELEIRVLEQESAGFEQKDVVLQIDTPYGTVHNATCEINRKSGHCNVQRRVGWAFLHGVLLVRDGKIVTVLDV